MLKRICKKIESFIRRVLEVAGNIPKLIQIAPKVLLDGGYLSVNIAHVNYKELLRGKRLIVTGGGSGIGLAIARKALDLGAVVLITGRDQEKLDRVIEAVDSPNLRSLVWDVSELKTLPENFSRALKALGGDFDILVNNAAVLSGALFPRVSEDDWDYVYGINSKGLYFLTQEVCRFWLKSDRSRIKKIVNISSQGGFVGATYPYRMTKWDVAGFTQGLGIALASKNIIVNGIAPGIIRTEMQKYYEDQSDNSYCELNPSRRIGSAEEIAELAAFLLSDASNFIVAQTIVCDGGFSVK